MNRLLIVDDNPTDRRLLSRILEKEGFSPFEADSGESALALARKIRPDLVLLDICLPDKDGFEICSLLKGSLDTASIPVVFVSSLDGKEEVAKGLELGGADFIIKPFETREVLARIRTQLRIRQLNVSLQEVNDDLLRLSNDLMDKQKRIEADLRAAAAIQQTLVPNGEVKVPQVETAWSFLPCENVGGDIFNVFGLDESHYGIYIVDVAGHGVPSAMVTVSVAQSLAPHMGLTVAAREGGEITAPSEVLTRLDEEYPLERFDRPFTICYGILDTSSGELAYSAAAHPPPILHRADGSVETLEEGGPVIGLGAFLAFDEGRVQLRKGDRVFFYTDGIVEHANPEGELFGQGRLLGLIERARGQDLQGLCDEIVRRLRIYGKGRPPLDDVSLLAIEFGAESQGPARKGGDDE